MTRKGGPSGPRGSRLDPYKPAIDRILEQDEGSLRRRSVRAICEELRIADVSKETVWAYVSRRRREMRRPELQDSRPA